MELEEDEKCQTLSYSKLMDFIADNHPVDPDTKKNFMVWDRVVVGNFWRKLMDPCGCYRLKKPCVMLKKYIHKK